MRDKFKDAIKHEEAQLEKRERLKTLNGFIAHSYATHTNGNKTNNIDREVGKYGFTDIGNAERFVRDHSDSVRYCHPWKKWMIFDGKRWKKDESAKVEQLAKETLRKMQRDASNEDDLKHKEKLLKHAVRSESDKRIKALLNRAKSEAGIPILPSDFDKDPWLLNVFNGTIDLRTGKLLQHDRNNYITKLASISFDLNAKASRFTRFMEEVFIKESKQTDYDLINYIQRCLGYCLTGSVKEQCFFIFYGRGANGKGTLMNLMQHIMGDYAGEVRPEILMKHKRQASAPSEDEANLHGLRLAKASETDSGRAFSEALVKRITGGDRIKARRLHGHLFEFYPTHKLFLLTNHKPEIQGTDHAIWRRVHMIPFNATFTPGADPLLEEDLQKEASGILNWLIDGCLKWQLQGLNSPEAVQKATNEYRISMDRLQRFLNERCDLFPNDNTGQIKAEKLWNAYKLWCTQVGEDAETQKRFGERMTEKGINKKRKNDGMYYLGILFKNH